MLVYFFSIRQCSECDKESSGSDFDRVDTSAPRKLRHCKDDSFISISSQESYSPNVSKNESKSNETTSSITLTTPKVNSIFLLVIKTFLLIVVTGFSC